MVFPITGPPWFRIGLDAEVVPTVGASASACGLTLCTMTSGGPTSTGFSAIAVDAPITARQHAATDNDFTTDVPQDSASIRIVSPRRRKDSLSSLLVNLPTRVLRIHSLP